VTARKAALQDEAENLCKALIFYYWQPRQHKRAPITKTRGPSGGEYFGCCAINQLPNPPQLRVLQSASVAGASTISTSADATPFVAYAEAGVAFKWLPTLTVRGFAGLNYDSKVPAK
jgi:hypothetical protein